MTEYKTTNSTIVVIRRSEKGLFKKLPAWVLMDNRLTGFFPGEMKEYHARPGNLTLTINRRKHLTFPSAAGETKKFVIKEGYTDFIFLLKYGFRFLLVIVLFIAVLTAAGYERYTALVIGLGILSWTLMEIRHEYFYIEEEGGEW